MPVCNVSLSCSSKVLLALVTALLIVPHAVVCDPDPLYQYIKTVSAKPAVPTATMLPLVSTPMPSAPLPAPQTAQGQPPTAPITQTPSPPPLNDHPLHIYVPYNSPGDGEQVSTNAMWRRDPFIMIKTASQPKTPPELNTRRMWRRDPRVSSASKVIMRPDANGAAQSPFRAAAMWRRDVQDDDDDNGEGYPKHMLHPDGEDGDYDDADGDANGDADGGATSHDATKGPSSSAQSANPAHRSLKPVLVYDRDDTYDGSDPHAKDSTLHPRSSQAYREQVKLADQIAMKATPLWTRGIKEADQRPYHEPFDCDDKDHDRDIKTHEQDLRKRAPTSSRYVLLEVYLPVPDIAAPPLMPKHWKKRNAKDDDNKDDHHHSPRTLDISEDSEHHTYQHRPADVQESRDARYRSHANA
ncbi:hypothetical protein RI367_007166 [Sorochytrium milnesiophthora]